MVSFSDSGLPEKAPDDGAIGNRTLGDSRTPIVLFGGS